MLTSYVLTASLLLLLVQVTIRVEGTHETECKRWEGSTRDCLCGRRVKYVEDFCQDEKTYFHPNSSQWNRFCDFECINGGIYDKSINICRCPLGYHGLCCEVESKHGICGEVLLGLKGTITSPGFPKYSYPRNEGCVWKIITDPERRIALSVKDNAFNIPAGSTPYKCDRDSLTIYDGETKDALKIGSYCGKGMRKLETVYSTNEHLYIDFKSDEEQGGGFQLHYTTFLRDNECGPRTVYSLETAIIASPNYPIGFKANADCKYEIQALPDHDIIITFLEINMKARAGLCTNGDRIVLTKENKVSNELEILTRFCGTDHAKIPPFTVLNPSRIFLTFTSNSRHSGTFKLRYNQVPSAVPTNGVFSS